jgi:hypothetical protein
MFPGLMLMTQFLGSVRKIIVPRSKEKNLEGLEGTKPLSVLSNNTYSLKINDIAGTKTY